MFQKLFLFSRRCKPPASGSFVPFCNFKIQLKYFLELIVYAEKIRMSSFRQSADGMLGRGVYLSRDLQKASRYPIGHPDEDKEVIMVQVNVGKVKVINYQNHPLQKTWHKEGYDTAWVPPNCGMTKSGLEEDCVWDPTRIRILHLIKLIIIPGQSDSDSADYKLNVYMIYKLKQVMTDSNVVRRKSCFTL
uniref:PARP catalytic domain-containing protein n=1 Tax=Poecilia reticulata TaxID=8081 RepID=A0A3P9P5T0_POERE